jgi:MarR family transcriptional regulator, organic hydroperoxide resistance regulator
MRLLTRAERLMSRRVTEIVGAHSHGVDAWRVLSLLADEGGQPMTAVADQVFLPPGTLTKLMDHLVEVGLVHRKVDPVDRRRIRAFLTPRGKALHDHIHQEVRAELRSLLASEAEAAHLTIALQTLVTALESRSVAAQVTA